MFENKARVEIERKFLIRGDAWRESKDQVRVRQGFLSIEKECTVRVRSVLERGVITVKGPTRGWSRVEYEYEIPQVDAEYMLQELCRGEIIEKIRTRVPWGDHIWEVDEFFGSNQGLILAEVELTSEEEEPQRPPWIDREVSSDPRYFNSYLALHPYTAWLEES